MPGEGYDVGMEAKRTERSTQVRRDRRKMRTQRAFGEAATRLFTERGFAPTTIEDIAEAADYSVSSFFRLFAKKEDVVFYDVPAKLDELRRVVDVADPAAVVSTIAATLLANARDWDAEEGANTLARFRLFHQEPALRSRYLEYCGEWEEVLAGLIVRGKGAGEPDDEIEAAMQAAGIVSAFRVAMSTYIAHRGTLAAHLERSYVCLKAPLLPLVGDGPGSERIQRDRTA